MAGETTQTNGTTNGTSTALAPQAAAATLEIAPRTGEIIRVGFDTVQGFEALQRIAKAFCASSLVPEAYRGPANLANAVIAVEMAMRMKASPLMVMQNLYIVHGRPGWSGQFYIASFNNCGRFSPIRYRFTGEKGKDSWGCVAWAREIATGEIVESAEITIAMAKGEGWYDKNQKWKTITQHMMMLRAGAWLVRTVAPELTMGLRSAEELEDIPADAEQTFTAPPVVATPAAVLAAAAESTQPGPTLLARVQAADSLAALDALLPEIRAVPQTDRAALTTAYTARKKALAAPKETSHA